MPENVIIIENICEVNEYLEFINNFEGKITIFQNTLKTTKAIIKCKSYILSCRNIIVTLKIKDFIELVKQTNKFILDINGIQYTYVENIELYNISYTRYIPYIDVDVLTCNFNGFKESIGIYKIQYNKRMVITENKINIQISNNKMILQSLETIEIKKTIPLLQLQKNHTDPLSLFVNGRDFKIIDVLNIKSPLSGDLIMEIFTYNIIFYKLHNENKNQSIISIIKLL